jgi:hypothetical protein
VRRFAKDQTEAIGHLLHGPGGRWLLHFDENDDEAGYHLDEDRFQLGEYVSVAAKDGTMHTFRVARVEKV